MGRKRKMSGHSYRVFSRAWVYPNGNPHPNASKRHIAFCDSEQEAREKCREWNTDHDPGPCSVKAEFERCK